jgi:hypothetical protein
MLTNKSKCNKPPVQNKISSATTDKRNINKNVNSKFINKPYLMRQQSPKSTTLSMTNNRMGKPGTDK